MPPRYIVVASLLGLAGCLEQGTPIDWPEPFETGFLVEIDPSGASMPLGPFDSAEVPPAYSLRKDHELFLITISPDAIDGIEPRFNRAHPELRLIPSSASNEAPECSAEGFLSSDPEGGERIERRIEDLESFDAARVYSLDTEVAVFSRTSADVLGDWSSSYAIVPCQLGTHLEVTTFAPESSLPRLRHVRHLNQDSLLLSSGARLMRWDRGASRPSAEWYVPSESLPEGESWTIVDVAVIPAGDDRYRALAITQHQARTRDGEESDVLQLRLVELEVGSSTISFVRVVLERGPTDEPRRLRALDLEPSGEFVAVGEGWWVTGALGSPEVHSHLLPAFDGLLVKWTGDPELPAAIAGRGSVWLGDPRLGPEGLLPEPPLGITEARWRGLATMETAEGLQVYVGANKAQLLARRQGVWTDVPIYPDNAAELCCADEICGRRRPARTGGRLEVFLINPLANGTEQLVSFVLNDCTGIFVSSLSEGCTTSDVLFGEKIAIDRNSAQFETSSRWQDRIVFAGEVFDGPARTGVLREVRVSFDDPP